MSILSFKKNVLPIISSLKKINPPLHFNTGITNSNIIKIIKNIKSKCNHVLTRGKNKDLNVQKIVN